MTFDDAVNITVTFAIDTFPRNEIAQRWNQIAEEIKAAGHDLNAVHDAARFHIWRERNSHYRNIGRAA